MSMPGTSVSSAGAGGPLGRLGGAVRAGEWWEYKLVPILALFYATALRQDLSLVAAAPALGLLLLALAPGAVYVSLINDLTDLREDTAAGKPNRMAGVPRPLAIGAVLACLAGGLLLAFHWRRDTLLLAVYLAAWGAFSLYSLPPVRLKGRGSWGALADASGAHLFPTLTGVVLAFRAADAPIDPLWLGAAATWALAYGLRGILWHQLLDAENDRAVALSTFVQRRGRDFVIALVRFGTFPLELAALALLLVRMGEPLPLLGLALYALLVVRRIHRFAMRLVVVAPQPAYMIVLQEYYEVLLPLSILALAALRHPADLAVLLAHLVIFPERMRLVARHAWRLRYRFGRLRPAAQRLR